MQPVEVRPCTAEAIRRLQQLGQSRTDMAHHRERFGWQLLGLAVYLLAWQGGQVVGRVTLLKESKYDEVRAAHAGLWEMNALEARPTGRGIGTMLIKASEEVAAENTGTLMGLAVGLTNLGALRLYRRLGYEEWPGGLVIDRWDQYDDAGRLVRSHADRCRYLVKPLKHEG